MSKKQIQKQIQKLEKKLDELIESSQNVKNETTAYSIYARIAELESRLSYLSTQYFID